MKILLINNNTQHLKDLQKSLVGHEVEMQMYKPGLDFHDQNKDLIILSGGGGEGLEIDDEHKPGHWWYEDEINFVLRNKKPLIGICMGFEVIARAYGSDVPKMTKLLETHAPVKTTKHGESILGLKNLTQFEAHQWHVTDAPKGFEVLADSDYGVEIIQKDNIFATQFHPEKAGTLRLKQVIA